MLKVSRRFEAWIRMKWNKVLFSWAFLSHCTLCNSAEKKMSCHLSHSVVLSIHRNSPTVKYSQVYVRSLFFVRQMKRITHSYLPGNVTEGQRRQGVRLLNSRREGDYHFQHLGVWRHTHVTKRNAPRGWMETRGAKKMLSWTVLSCHWRVKRF